MITFESFGEGVMNPIVQERMKQAREDWRTTDAMTVRSYSYSLNTLRITFDSATLEILANGPTVDWRLNNLPLPSLEACGNPCLLIHTEYEDKQEFFDRDAVLCHILGMRIRFAPSQTELYLIWKPNHEISLNSLPLADQTECLLHYAGPYA
jgi:hypothetical protein